MRFSRSLLEVLMLSAETMVVVAVPGVCCMGPAPPLSSEGVSHF